ncbi:UPF0545 protein C22orf39 homolog [Copidosoma floridanum]|uniref:UPF0545 protein C22orf39 homolog n=1 Tax=Copidosoma floridanum TaxID=29053 RepID=UPI0006C9D1AF|nr:UPF0545 protein C22orf39 homolog [Copidosoma floridanum]
MFDKAKSIEKEVLRERRPDEFMIRPCHIYNDEFYECERPKGRFHQYFIFGEYLNCWQWQMDFENCKKWKESQDEEAYALLIASEKKRRTERLKGHIENDVWEKRDKPPENWDAPLPEWLEKKNANTYLDFKAKSIRDGTVNDLDVKMYNACTIL